MHRLILVGLAAAFLPASGCAKAPVVANTSAVELPPVNAGPSPCDLLFERLRGAQPASAQAAWFGGPERMAEAHRVRALEARAAALGCGLPRS